MERNERIQGYFEIIYPNFKGLSIKEKKQSAIDKNIITKYIDEIDEQVYRIENEKEGSATREVLLQIIRSLQAEEYFQILCPSYYSISKEERAEVIKDKALIAANIEEVRDRYEGYMKLGDIAPVIAMKNVINSIKADNIFNTLYPDFSKLNVEEKIKAAEDKQFITENIDLVLNGVAMLQQEKDKLSVRKSIIKALEVIRNRKYFGELYPNYESLSMKDKAKAIADKRLIENNIDKIDAEYKVAMKNKKTADLRYSGSKVIYEILKNIKIQKIFEDLYAFDGRKSTYADAIRQAVIDNFEEVENEMLEMQQVVSYEKESKEARSKRTFNIVWDVIARCVFQEMYPNWKKMQQCEKDKALQDKDVIIANLQVILERFYKAQSPNSVEQQKGFNNKKILQEIIKSIKIENALKELNLSGHKLTPVESDTKKLIIEKFDEIDDLTGGSLDKRAIEKSIQVVKTQNYMNILCPNYNNRSIKNKAEYNGARATIGNNLLKVDQRYKDAHRKNSIEQKNGYSDKKILEEIVKSIKVDTYFGYVYPNINKLSVDNKIKAANIKGIMNENIEYIDSCYQSEKNRNQKASNEQIMDGIVYKVLTDNLVNKAYPNYSKLSGGKKDKADADIQFIKENMVTINNMYTDKINYLKKNGNIERNVIQDIIRAVKVDTIYNKLYPNLANLTQADRKKAYQDKEILSENVDIFENVEIQNLTPNMITKMIEDIESNKNSEELKSNAKVEQVKLGFKYNEPLMNKNENDYTEEIKEVKWKNKLKQKFCILTKFFKRQKAIAEKNVNV